MLKDFIITTSFRPEADQIDQAQRLAKYFGQAYLERQKLGLKRLIGERQGALVVSKEHLAFVHRQGQHFRFHPDTAMLRIKSQHDPLLDLLGHEPKRVLDATLGMANDSLVMAYAGHQVVGVEASPLVHLIVSQGLATYQSGSSSLTLAMRSIETHCSDSLSYMQQEADRSFDMVYFDPMFSQALDSSPDFAGLRDLADHQPLTEELLAEAKRLARQGLIIKAHYRDPVFERFGFERQVRPNTPFHYGWLPITQ